MKLLLVITSLPFLVSQEISFDDDLNLDPTLGDRFTHFLDCKTKDGRDGLCVQESYCNEDHTIMPGGVIAETEFREMTTKPCPGLFMWCCTQDSALGPPVINDTRSDSCQALDHDRCPWCVKLYKVSDLKNTDTDVFCAGSLIGSRIILTAATCLKSAQHHMLYARIPSSANPNQKYIAKHRKLHPQYNTGTHWFDFGIIVLEEEVNWGVTPARGACLNFGEISGRCFTLGYDTNDEFVSTILKVSKGACSNMGGGGSTDVSCGTSMEKLCFASPGAPVICESSLGGLVLQGIVRSGCEQKNVSLGTLTSPNPWIIRELDAMHVSKNIYTQR
ncbi:unnamed protein product, partial [Brenthis ino]